MTSQNLGQSSITNTPSMIYIAIKLPWYARYKHKAISDKLCRLDFIQLILYLFKKAYFYNICIN